MSDTSQAAPAVNRVHVLCLLGLTFATGIIDALSWTGLDGVFTANMTGNVLIIGMGLGGAPDARGVASLFSLVAFLLGSAVSGRIQHRQPPGWSPRTTAIFGSVAGIVLAMAVVTALWPPHRSAASAYVVMGILAFAMGVQASEALRLAVPQLITVAVSSAVIGVGISLFLGTGANRGTGVPRRAAAIVLLVGGAWAGTLLIGVSFAAGLFAAGAIAVAITVFGHLRRDIR